jgi:hypothetical protein
MEIVIMTIKNTIYSAHQRLEQLAQIPVKRSHFYELMAAAFGFNTYASLTHQAILIQRKSPTTAGAINLDLIQQRSELLGYGNKLTTALPVAIDDHRIGVLTFADLVVSQLRNEDYLVEYEWEADDSSQLITPEILHSLETSAKAENPLAHYALALHYDDSDEGDEDGISTDYWYKQMQSGRVLSGVEKEFALAYQDQLTTEKKYEFHLREAARFGSELAQLDLAEHFDDHAFFEGDHRDVDANPMRVAEIAKELGRHEDYHYWLRVAAEAGNVDAMRELIENDEKDDLLSCWTWVYLSQLLNNDLTQSNYYAIHDDGSLYDDDVGGTMHVAGEERVDLPPLASELDSQARVNAETLFKRINT